MAKWVLFGAAQVFVILMGIARHAIPTGEEFICLFSLWAGMEVADEKHREEAKKNEQRQKN